jgi:hypothetical protein
MTLVTLLELPLTLIHETEIRRGTSCFRGNPRHSHGMLDQVLIDTLGRCINGLDDHPELRQELVTAIRKGAPLLAGVAFGEKLLEDLVAQLGISPAKGSWADVNLTSGQIDMRYIDLHGSLKRLYSISDGPEANPWSAPALSESTLSLNDLQRSWTSKTLIPNRNFDPADLTSVPHRKLTYCMDRILMHVDEDEPNRGADKKRPNICHMCMKKDEIGKGLNYCAQCKIAVYCSKACRVLCRIEC